MVSCSIHIAPSRILAVHHANDWDRMGNWLFSNSLQDVVVRLVRFLLPYFFPHSIYHKRQLFLLPFRRGLKQIIEIRLFHSSVIVTAIHRAARRTRHGFVGVLVTRLFIDTFVPESDLMVTVRAGKHIGPNIVIHWRRSRGGWVTSRKHPSALFPELIQNEFACLLE